MPITPQRVTAAGIFGLAYFSIEKDGSVSTLLQPGHLICNDVFDANFNQNRTNYLLIQSIDSVDGKLIIKGIDFFRNILCEMIPHKSMYAKTFLLTLRLFALNGTEFTVGDRIFMPSPYYMGMLKLDDSCGVIENINKCTPINELAISIRLESGRMICVPVSYLYRLVKLRPDEDYSEMVTQMSCVKLGISVQKDGVHLGKIVMIMYLYARRIIPFYVIRTPDGNIIYETFDKKIVPLHESQVTNQIALQYYHDLYNNVKNAKVTDNYGRIFCHERVALRSVAIQDGKHLVAFERGLNHFFNNGMQLTSNNSAYGFFYFDDTMRWEDYGFACTPRDKKELTCHNTGVTTMTDFE